MSFIEIKNLKKKYGENTVLENINLVINKGDFIVIVGPSGCGKTTLLKTINGLIQFDEGEIKIDGRLQKDWDPIVLKRSIGYVIQQIGLFPHLSISDNISYVLNIQNVKKEIRDKKARELIEVVGLDPSYLSRYPRELSGGQKQRIGVARAIAGDPDIILMDEPFGAVDEIIRKVLQDELKCLHEKLKKTILFVTHDIDEAIRLGTRIVIMDKGRIVQEGNKKEVVFFPKNQFVSDFFGLKNFTSYLSQIRVGDVVSADIGCCEKYVDEDISVLEALKYLFDLGIYEIGVKNRNGKEVGTFRIDSIKEKILQQNMI